MKIYLKLLTASLLLSAVNFNNPSYSMEKNKIQINNQDEVLKKLNTTNVSFKEIYDKYSAAKKMYKYKLTYF